MSNCFLKCACCGQETCSHTVRVYEDFAIAGYDLDTVSWMEYNVETKTKIDLEKCSYSESLPKCGELRIIKVHTPFYLVVGELFWTLFGSFEAVNEGFEEVPSEIEKSAFVQAKTLQIVQINNAKTEAWVQVKVEAVVMLIEAVSKIPLKPLSEQFIPSLFDFAWEMHDLDGYLYFNGAAQGDLGQWLLFQKMPDPRLIAFGEWEFHANSAYLGNLTLTEQQYTQILSKCCNAQNLISESGFPSVIVADDKANEIN